jgi:hypothetical protein
MLVKNAVQGCGTGLAHMLVERFHTASAARSRSLQKVELVVD